jgi:hypothetical protein
MDTTAGVAEATVMPVKRPKQEFVAAWIVASAMEKALVPIVSCGFGPRG